MGTGEDVKATAPETAHAAETARAARKSRQVSILAVPMEALKGAPDQAAPAPPLFRVQRWRRSKWRSVTQPLSQVEANRQAAELKRRVSAFHVRVVRIEGEAHAN